MPRVLTYTEGNTEAPVNTARVWRSAGVLRPWHARRDILKNSGSPIGFLVRGEQENDRQ